jgi:hypothetical protein
MDNGRLTHCVSALCDAPAAHAYAYLVDAERLGEWALGCWDTRAAGPGVVRGTSLFDGGATFVRVRPYAECLTVDFEVGRDPARLVRRISARVVASDDLEAEVDRSLVIVLAWRTAAMDDSRWHRLTASHDAEVLLLCERIERSVAA